jgi:ABC-type transport system involved in multi-copper enzyme maturation permease subunit
MIASIIKFELKYRLIRPATYIYAAIFLALGLLVTLTDAVRIGGVYGKINANAPQALHFFVLMLSSFGLFIVMAVMSVPVFRDWEHKSDTFLFAYPITKYQYLIGRFIGSFIVLMGIYLMIPIGFALGEIIGKMTTDDPNKYGPFRLTAYLNPYFTAALPNILLLSALFFGLVAITRKVMIAYVVAISFIVVYSISQNLLSDLDNKFVAALLDPFGITATEQVTEYWSVHQKNNELVPFTGVLLLNRLLWLAVGFAILGYTFLRFQLTVGVGGKPKKLADSEEAPASIQQLATPSVHQNFDMVAQIKQLVTLLRLETALTFRNLFFLALMFAIALFMVMDAWYSDYSYGTGIYPVTGILLENVTSGNFFILTLALMIFSAGEIVWREKQFQMAGIYDAFPIASSTAFVSKLLAMLLIPFFVLLLIPIVCIPMQIIKGVTNVEPLLYLKTLFVFELPRLMLYALFAFIVQNTVNNKFQGHVLVLLYYISLIGFSRIGLEHPLWRYGSGLTYTYSDMNGFEDSVKTIKGYLSHWTLISVFLSGIGFLFFHRGAETGTKARLTEAVNRWKRLKPLKVLMALSALASMGTGFYIYYNTVKLDNFMSEKEFELKAVAYEKKYKQRLKDIPEPKFTAVKLEADIFPEELKLRVKGTYYFKNKTKEPIDTFWLSLNDAFQKRSVNISLPGTWAICDSVYKLQAYAFEKALQPGDSGILYIDLEHEQSGFNHSGLVRGNGTFFNNATLFGIGYNDGYELSDADKRKKYNLPEKDRMPLASDSAAKQYNFITSDADYIDFEATISTSKDQIAVAPGYLQKQWVENGRAYFHYKMDITILNFVSILSARYAVFKDKWNDVSIEIYHHPTHTYNLAKMVESVKDALSYYSENFGPYQHKQVRILEFPRYSSFAQSFDNTIPYSEGIGFIAKLTDPEDVDYVYFVTAHEMAHQWYGHQVVPANVRGAQFLSESMSEYSALKVMQKKYGYGLSGKFLRYELNQYLRGRSNEKKFESTLMEVEQQGYVYYPKGSISVFAIQDYIGEYVFNAFLKRYIDSVRFAGPPYTIMPEFYHQLMQVTPEEYKEFVDDNLKRITLFRNKAVSAKGKKLANGQYEVRMKIELEKVYTDSLGKETPASINIPIEVGLLAAKKPVKAEDLLLVEKRKVKSGDEVVLVLAQKPAFVGIDPMHKLIDENLEDNTIKIDWE